MATLQTSARLLFAVGFAGAIASAPVIVACVGLILSPAAQNIGDPSDNCTSNQRNVSYYLDCAPNVGVIGPWVPPNDWYGGAPSESALTQQNQFRH